MSRAPKRNTKLIDYRGEELVVKELLLSEVEEALTELEDLKYHPLDWMSDLRVPSPALFLSIGTTVEKFGKDVAYSEAEELLAAFEEVNPTFVERVKANRQLRGI